ncbi:MAG: PKD domain-containing protein, partial [Bacteroidia bacterium]
SHSSTRYLLLSVASKALVNPTKRCAKFETPAIPISISCNATVVVASASLRSPAGEYFFDTDQGVGSGMTTATSSGDSIFDTLHISTTGLTTGFHNFFFRAKDTNSIWSLYEGAGFYLYDTVLHTVPPPPNPIISAEYFYDLDPGIGHGIPIANFTHADSITLNDTLPSAPLVAGTHNLFLRLRDSMNRWSLYEGRSFVVCNFIPVANFSADTVCLHSPTTFTDLSSNLDTSANYTYAWDFNSDGIIDNATKGTTTYTFTSPGTHTVTLIVNNTGGCTDTIKKIIYVDSLPIVTLHFPADTVCKHDTLMLSGGNPTGGIYSGKGVYGGAFYPDSAGTGFHTITYTYFNMDSCSATASEKIFVSLCTGINEHTKENFSVTVSPNPFNTTTTFTIHNSQLSDHNIQFILYDVVGKEIRNKKPETENFKLDREDLPGGIYFYKIIVHEGDFVTGKIVVTD